MTVETIEYIENKGDFSEYPDYLEKDLVDLLLQTGYKKLYCHQLEALNAIQAINNVVVATGTASGKSLCYQIPILDNLLKDQNTTSLLLFPTKALANDQKIKFLLLVNHSCILSADQIGVYDGDTPQNERTRIINHCKVVISNPDMLHIGILPHHTSWQKFFSSLKFIVLDEIHYYKGIFGSHIANVIRRLLRICSFYNSKPQFVLTSATIGNSKQHAEALIEQRVKVISRDGSPHGNKTFFLLNPPIIDKNLGIRKSSNSESLEILDALLSENIQTILFTITRKSVEILWKNFLSNSPQYQNAVFGYRSGYLPKSRRQIEEKIRTGEVKGVISTNALELGIDIGSLDAVIINGYPGSISSIFQQLGRAGRHQDDSLTFLVASQTPMDQFLMLHPQTIKQGIPESVQINPNNPVILLEHLRAAIFELPFSFPYKFGDAKNEAIQNAVEILENIGEIYQRKQKAFWLGSQYPASDTSLRNIGGSGYSLLAINPDGHKENIGTVDESSIYWMVHPQAVYLHEGNTYLVEELNEKKREVVLHQSETDYFTFPIQHQEIRIISRENQLDIQQSKCSRGTVLITQQVMGFKKIRWMTQELLGIENIEMPVTELETCAYWFSIGNEVIQSLIESDFWSAGAIDYGPVWNKRREEIRSRDNYTCQYCGIKEGNNQHHVHHKMPFRNFNSPAIANSPDNLITLCSLCHRKAEVSVYIRSGLTGLSFLLHNLASLYVQCDLKDLGVSAELKTDQGHPYATIFLHDMAPGGTGLSDALFDHHEQLLRAAYDLAIHCSCTNGCPACIGPIINDQVGGKKEVLAILEKIIE